MQAPALTTHATRNNSFSLLVALDDQQNAKGDLFWDDGESTNITQYVMKVLLIVYSLYVILYFRYIFVSFKACSPGSLTGKVFRTLVSAGYFKAVQRNCSVKFCLLKLRPFMFVPWSLASMVCSCTVAKLISM